MLFKCSKCQKKLSLQPNIFEKAYKGHDTCLDCRPKHGGSREGAGRPSLGTTKKVSVTLPDDIWEKIEGEGNKSAFFRDLALKEFEK